MFEWTEINFALGENGGFKPNGLGGRLILVVRQVDEILAV